MNTWINKLQRPREGRLVAGVCQALADALVLDVTLVRLAFLVLALGKGLGLVVYLALWILLPGPLSAGQSWRGVVWLNVRGFRRELVYAAGTVAEIWSRGERTRWPLPVNRRWLALGLLAGGALVLLWSLGLFSWLGPARSLGLAAMAVGGAVLFSLTREP